MTGGKNKTNGGIAAANKAAYAVDGLVVWPEFEDGEAGSDFNDLHALRGLDAVKNTILAALSPPRARLDAGGDATGDFSSPAPEDAPASVAIPTGVINSEIIEPASSRIEDFYNLFIYERRPDPNWIINPDSPYVKPPKFVKCEKNVETFLTKYAPLANIFKLDIFSGRLMVTRCPPWENQSTFVIREKKESDVSEVLTRLNSNQFFPSRGMVEKMIETIAEKYTIDPPVMLFNSLKWDGVARLESFCGSYLGATSQDGYYLSCVGKWWIISAVARQYRPGCQVDYMPVFEGLMGIRKSSMMRELNTFGDQCFFLEDINFAQLDRVDTVAKLQGKLMVEFADLARFNTSNIEQIRAWITRRTDEGRLAYRRDTTPFKRRFVMAATANRANYLSELDGERRMWPVICGDSVDIEAIKRDREQLWAEAVHRYKAGEKWWPERNDKFWELATREQIKRVDSHPYDDIVSDALATRRTPITFTELMKLIDLPPSVLTNAGTAAILRGSLKKAGWEKRDYDRATKAKHVYVPAGWGMNENAIDGHAEVVEETEIPF